MILNEDYKEMLRCLAEENVKFLLIGAYALGAYGYLRATMDIDLWIKPSPENARAVLQALRRFGAPLHGLTTPDLLSDDTVFQIGVAPRRIDLLTGASGLRFDETWDHAVVVNMDGLDVRIPSIPDLIRNKRASGRAKDLADVEALESM